MTLARTVHDASQPVVIFVDDDKAVSEAVQFSMELDGLDVRTFADAERLLKSGELPERGCLVLDVRLPGMDGLQLLEQLRRRKVMLPAVLITTAPSQALKAAARNAGAAIVEKPLLTEALLDAVRAAIAESLRRPAGA